MSYAFSPDKFGLVEPDHDGPIILPGASRAERDVPGAFSAAHVPGIATIRTPMRKGGGSKT